MEQVARTISQKRIKTPVYELWIKDGILYGDYTKGTVVDLEISKQVLRARTILCEGKAYPILGYAYGVKYWTKEAKKFHSSDEYSKHVKAVAVLISSPVLAVLFDFYQRFYHSRFPIRVFSDEKKALEWLEQFKE